MAFSLNKFRTASAGLAGLAFLAGCGGGGDSGIDRPAPDFELGEIPAVKAIATPLGTTGSRGSGAAVFVSMNLVDREFNICDAEIEYGYDGNNGGAVDGVITGSEGDPSATDEYSRAIPHPTSPIGWNQSINAVESHPWNLEAARGKGADHVFVWDSATDLPGRRYVTQDYVYVNDGWDGTPTGRVDKNSDGTDKLEALPGLRLRMRVNDSGGAADRWSPWTYTQPFDINNNTLPAVSIDATGLNGVVPNASGTAADEDVQLNFHAYDNDTGIPAGNIDRVAVHVDFARADTTMTILAGAINAGTNAFTVPGHNLSNGDEIILLSSTGATPAGVNAEQTYFVKVTDGNVFTITDVFNMAQGIPAGLGEDVDIFNAGSGTHTFGVDLQWTAAGLFAGGADTMLDTDTVPFGGVAHSFKWDSVADAGTINGDYILRITPFDQKNENGATTVMNSWFRLDNFTIFTDAGTALPTARVGHRLSTLPDGTVLITGGREALGGSSVNKVVMFFPSIGQTTLGALATKASMGTARAYHSQTRLYDDRLLVAGGFTGASTALNTLELYNPVTNTWSPAGVSLTTARARHTAVLLANGDVLLAGGVDSSGNPLSSAEIYHPDTNTVTQVPGGLNAARHTVGGVLLPDYTVLIAGGTGASGAALSSVEIFDPAGNAGAGDFVTGTALPAARANHTTAIATNGKVVVTGGTGGAGALNTLTVYDPQTGNWTNAANMSSARSSHIGVLMGDGKVLLAGGNNGAGVLATGQMYDPSTNSYDALNGSMVTARSEAETTILKNGRVLIVGGVDGAGQPMAGIEIFTPDGGFNNVPVARAATPEEPQSFSLGAVIPVRLLDAEEDRARFIALFSYFDTGAGDYTPWKSCTPAGGPYGDGIPDTIADDYSDGMVDLETTDTDLPLPINPKQDNTGGDEADHFFVWKIEDDIAVKADYDLVKVRIIPFGAAQGTEGTTFAFRIVSNTRIITHIDPLTPNVSGAVQLDYHLRDIDGDTARVEFEYAIDLNGDGQILDTQGEAWAYCTPAPGGDGLGNGYTLSTALTYNPVVGSDAGWHSFIWDSVRDIGSPDPDDLDPYNDLFNDPSYTAGDGNKQIYLRVTPFDDPNGGSPADESKGLFLTLGESDGLIIERDPNALFLTQWATEGGVVYAGSTLGDVKIDEHIIFTFNRNVDPSSVNTTTISIKSGTKQLLGTFEATGTNVVTWYPQVNSVSNGTLTYDGTENPTVLTRNVPVSINIPGYTPGTDPETSNILRVEPSEYTPGDAASAVALVHGNAHGSAFQTSNSAGTAAYFGRTVNPTVISANPPLNDVNQALTQGFTFTFDYPVNPESCTTSNLKFVVDLNGDNSAATNDSIVPGTWTVVNTVGPTGVCQAVVTFTPLNTITLPAASKVLASFAGITAGDGDAVLGIGGGAPVTYFTTQAGALTSTPFSESFENSTNKDTTAGATTALWNISPFSGMLTGNRDGGSGADNTPSPNGISGTLWTFNAKNDYNFTSFTIPKNQTWRFTGSSNAPVTIRSTTDFDIAGVLDVSGGDVTAKNGYMMIAATSSATYGMRYSSLPSVGAVAHLGGTGIAGGGAGGSSLHRTGGQSGANGTGATSGFGYGSAQYSSYSTGGGGGAHAQNGQNGGSYTSGYWTSPSTIGGTAYGTSNFSPTLTAGSGGGAGSSYTTAYSYSDESYHGSGSYSTYYYLHPGGAGGGGGGALKLMCNGTFKVRGSGRIDASGGNGQEAFYYYSGAGGGGSGGSVWIICGGDMTLNGIIDVRGGLGGEVAYYRSFGQQSPTRWGSYGGDGSAGRIRIEAPNVTGTQVNFLGGAAMNTIAASNGGALSGGTGALNAFPGSTTTTINLASYSRDAQGYYNFTSMNIPSNTTVTLQGSFPARMRFTGNVTINGTLRAPGTNGAAGQYGSGSAYNHTPAQSVLGSGAGGICNPTSTTTAGNAVAGYDPRTGTPGGAGGGPGLRGGQPVGWVNGSYTYYYGGSAGAGGLNRVNAPTAAVGIYAGNMGLTNNRTTAGQFMHYITGYYNANTQGGVVGTAVIDPELIMMGPGAPAGGEFVGGAGGGGGANGVYGPTNSTQYFYGGTTGGSGGGAIGIETAGTFTMGSAGRIDVQGGNGGSYSYSYPAGSGGAGAGGTVLVRAASLAISANATISPLGGTGGWAYNSASNYAFMGGDGGCGGIGVVRIEATTLPNLLNVGGLLGITSTSGSVTLATNVGGGPLGTMLYRDAAGLAPDFNTAGIAVAPSGTWQNSKGNVAINLQGQMRDPITGAPSSTLTYSQNLITNPLTTGLGTPDLIDGYYRWRFVYTLNPATAGNPFPPEIYDVALKVDTK